MLVNLGDGSEPAEVPEHPPPASSSPQPSPKPSATGALSGLGGEPGVFDFVRPDWAETYLCHACSCHKIVAVAKID
jgi:hypothetical protein